MSDKNLFENFYFENVFKKMEEALEAIKRDETLLIRALEKYIKEKDME